MHTRKKLNKQSMRNILNEAYPKGCTSIWVVVCNMMLTRVAKTGQSLIANPIFDSLPSTTSASKDDSAMQVDTSVEAAGEKEKETDASKASGKKYNAPVDGQSGDLIIEGTAYLRLLLVLMNLDAGKVEEVSSSPNSSWAISSLVQAAKFGDETAEILATANRRSMDQISAKVHFYLALAYERLGRLEELQA